MTTTLLLISLLLNALTIWALVVVTKKAVDMSDKLEETEGFLEESYDRLQQNHNILEERSKTEVFSDEPLVKEVVAEIHEAKKSIQVVLEALQEYSKKPVEGSMDEKQKD